MISGIHRKRQSDERAVPCEIMLARQKGDATHHVVSQTQIDSHVVIEDIQKFSTDMYPSTNTSVQPNGSSSVV
jgi:hypothetical protein